MLVRGVSVSDREGTKVGESICLVANEYAGGLLSQWASE